MSSPCLLSFPVTDESSRSVTCGKVAYPSRNDALLTLALIRAKGDPRRREHAAYPCACGNWHLTTKRPEKWGVRGGHRAWREERPRI